MAVIAVFVGNDESQGILVPQLKQTGIELHCFTDLVEALNYVSFEEGRPIRYLITSKEMLADSERINQLSGALWTASSGWTIERPIDPSDAKLTTELINQLKRAVAAERKPPKRVLFLGDKDFIFNMGTLLSNDDLSVCYATQTQMAISLAKNRAVDLIIIDLTSIPQDEIDQLIGSPRPKDVDATAPYEEPKVNVPG